MGKTSRELLTKYGLSGLLLRTPTRANEFDRFHAEARQTAFDMQNRLGTFVNNGAATDEAKIARLRTLMDTLTESGTSPHYRRWANALGYFNAYTGRTEVDFPGTACTLAFWEALSNTSTFTNRTNRDEVCSYLTYHRNAPSRLCSLWQARGMSGRLNDILRFIATARKAGTAAAVLYERLRADSVANALTLAALYPPGSSFAGFTKWGTGDQDTADANLMWHFLKHVCCVSEEGEVFPEESAMWWGVLDVRLTLADFRTYRPGGDAGDARSEGLFLPLGATPDNRTLARGNVARFLQDEPLTSHPRLLGHLTNTYKASYSRYALASSRELGIIRIELEPFNAFIGGFVGSIYVVGRLDEKDHNNSVALSSCYICLDVYEKMRSSERKELWALRG